MGDEHLPELNHRERVFQFRPDPVPPFRMAFWLVESEEHAFPSPERVTGNESEEFFRALADAALTEWG
jgi:hypothetical protein